MIRTSFLFIVFAVAFAPIQIAASAQPAASCDQICSNVDAAIAKDKTTKCQANDPKSPTNNPGTQTSTPQAMCFNAVEATFGQVKAYCVAYQSEGKANTNETITAAVYTAAAAVCTVTCGLELACAACPECAATCAAAAAMEPVCSISGIGAGITDVVTSIMMKQYMKGIMTGLSAGAGAAIGGQLGMMSTTLGVGPASPGGASPASQAGYGGCVGMVFLGAVAGIKWANMGDNSSKKAENCQNIQNLLAHADFGSLGNDLPSTGPKPTPTVSGNVTLPIATATAPTASTQNLYTAPQTLASQAKSDTKSTFGDFVNKGNGLSAMAEFSEKDPFFKEHPNSHRLFETLEKNKIEPKSLIQKLDSQSPMGAIGSSGDIASNPKLQAALEQMDKDLRTGKINAEFLSAASPLSYKSTRSGGNSMNSQVGSFSWGQKPFGSNAQSNSAPTTQSFNKKTISQDPPEIDIWHENSQSTIFQIVSGRIDRTKPRVEKLEWVSPINRAMVGLPPKSKK